MIFAAGDLCILSNRYSRYLAGFLFSCESTDSFCGGSERCTMWNDDRLGIELSFRDKSSCKNFS